MEKLNLIARTEQVAVDKVERITHIEIRDGVVTAFIEVAVDGRVKDTYNVGHAIEELPKELDGPVTAIADAAKSWVEDRRTRLAMPVTEEVTGAEASPAVVQP